MNNNGTHLGKVLVGILVISAVLNFGFYYFAGYEVAVIFALSWLTAVIATATVGIENTINQKP
jgi:hypothetical protein